MGHLAKVSAAIAAVLWITACGQAPEGQGGAPGGAFPPSEVGVLEVSTRSQAIQVELPGRSRAYLQAEVRPQVSGIVMERSFIEGRDVKKGDSLYQIDPATYEAALVKANADLVKAQAALATAQAKAKRSKSLVSTNAISEQDFDDAEAAYKEAKASVDVAKAAINTAEINLRYTEVISPISGRIGKSTVTAGALVTANQSQALATIQQLDPINVDISQSSAALLRLKGQLRRNELQASDDKRVELVLEDGSVYPLKGKLQFVEVSVNESTGSVTLRAEFPNPDGILMPGMFVRARINTAIDPNAILVPQKAITRNTKGEAVAMVVNKENVIEARNVVTAEAIDNQWRITSGLQEGDNVVVQGLQKIRPGAPVVIAGANAPAEPKHKG